MKQNKEAILKNTGEWTDFENLSFNTGGVCAVTLLRFTAVAPVVPSAWPSVGRSTVSSGPGRPSLAKRHLSAFKVDCPISQTFGTEKEMGT